MFEFGKVQLNISELRYSNCLGDLRSSNFDFANCDMFEVRNFFTETKLHFNVMAERKVHNPIKYKIFN